MNTIVIAVALLVNALVCAALVHGIFAAWEHARNCEAQRNERLTPEEAAEYVLQAYKQGLKEAALLHREMYGVEGTDNYLNRMRVLYKEATVDVLIENTTPKEPQPEPEQPSTPTMSVSEASKHWDTRPSWFLQEQYSEEPPPLTDADYAAMGV